MVFYAVNHYGYIRANDVKKLDRFDVMVTVRLYQDVMLTVRLYQDEQCEKVRQV